MNSDYLRRQYYKNVNLKRKFLNEHFTIFPILETSHDIFFLFQTIIFEQIRSFDPDFVIVSYNGFLNINEDHWNEIVKNLTIIANHKISLFVDFIDKLKGKSSKMNDEETDED